MSEVRLVVRDREREIPGTIHGSVADAVIAALSDDPGTIEELEAALERFHASLPKDRSRRSPTTFAKRSTASPPPVPTWRRSAPTCNGR